MMTSGS